MRAQRGFTLVEILIVVVILGILAAIVIPQFTQASSEAKLNSLCSDLQSLRSQIELYKCQHNDKPPASAVLFEHQMIYCSDIAGTDNDSKVRSGSATFGPYLERLPVNPFTNKNTVVGSQGTAGAAGWVYNATTGEIKAHLDTIDPNHVNL